MKSIRWENKIGRIKWYNQNELGVVPIIFEWRDSVTAIVGKNNWEVSVFVIFYDGGDPVLVILSMMVGSQSPLSFL